MNYEVKKIWPIFFWTYCECCQRDFKKEYGWKILPGCFSKMYMCCDCCPTEEDVRYILDESGCYMMSLKMPPPGNE